MSQVSLLSSHRHLLDSFSFYVRPKKTLPQTSLPILTQTFYLESLSFTVSDSTEWPPSRFNKGLWMLYWKYLFGHWPLKQIQFIQFLIQAAFQLQNAQIPFCRGLPSLTELFKPLYHTSLHKAVIDSHLQGRASQVSPEGTKCHHLQWFKCVISMEPTGNPKLHVNIHLFLTASQSPAFRHLQQVDLYGQNQHIKPIPLTHSALQTLCLLVWVLKFWFHNTLCFPVLPFSS